MATVGLWRKRRTRALEKVVHFPLGFCSARVGTTRQPLRSRSLAHRVKYRCAAAKNRVKYRCATAALRYLAAQEGHLQAVRTLCLSGCNRKLLCGEFSARHASDAHGHKAVSAFLLKTAEYEHELDVS